MHEDGYWNRGDLFESVAEDESTDGNDETDGYHPTEALQSSPIVNFRWLLRLLNLILHGLIRLGKLVLWKWHSAELYFYGLLFGLEVGHTAVIVEV